MSGWTRGLVKATASSESPDGFRAYTMLQIPMAEGRRASPRGSIL